MDGECMDDATMFEIARSLWPDVDDGRLAQYIYSVQTLAIRLIHFGWEDGVNLLDPQSRAFLSVFVWGHSRNVIAAEAVARGVEVRPRSETCDK